MAILKDKPNFPEPKKRPLGESGADYSKYTTDELLDERNLFKSEGLNTFEIDEALRRKYA